MTLTLDEGEKLRALAVRAALWPDPDVFSIEPFGWLKPLAYTLNDQFGVSPVGSVALPLSVIAAMAGGGYWLRDPGGMSTCAPLNIVFTGSTGSPFRAVADDLWSLPRTRLGHVAQSTPADRKAAMRELEGTHRELVALNDQIEKLRGQKPQPSPFSGLGSSQPDPKMTELIKQRVTLLEKIKALMAGCGQVLLAEGVAFDALLTPCNFTFDAAVHHLSTDGGIAPRLAAAQARLLAELAQVSGNILKPMFCSETIAPLPIGMVSHTLVLGEDQARKFLGSGALRSSGFTDSFLAIDLRNHKPVDINFAPNATSPWDDYYQVLEQIFQSRISGEREFFELSVEAAKAFDRYVRNRHAAAVRLGRQCPPVLDRLGPLVLKFALSIHLSRGLSKTKEVDVTTLNAACTILDAGISSHLGAAAEFRGHEYARALGSGDDAQVEIVVERLRVRGRLSRRDLARTFHRQKSEAWEPALARALETGRIYRDEEGCFVLPNNRDAATAAGDPGCDLVRSGA